MDDHYALAAAIAEGLAEVAWPEAVEVAARRRTRLRAEAITTTQIVVSPSAHAELVEARGVYREQRSVDVAVIGRLGGDEAAEEERLGALARVKQTARRAVRTLAIAGAEYYETAEEANPFRPELAEEKGVYLAVLRTTWLAWEAA